MMKEITFIGEKIVALSVFLSHHNISKRRFIFVLHVILEYFSTSHDFVHERNPAQNQKSSFFAYDWCTQNRLVKHFLLPLQRSSQVPKFGKWDDGDDVPYTTYFDNATKAKFERMNPNDPLPHREEISETVRSNYEQQKIKEGGVMRRQPESPLHHDALEMSGRDYNGIKSAKRRGQQLSGPKHTQEDLSMEDGNMKKQLGSPLDHRSMGQVSFNSPLHQRQGNNSSTSNSSKGTMRNGTVSECSIENSPLHSRQHPRTEPKTVVPSSPLRDRRGSSSPRGSSHEGLAPLTPGRSRQRSVPRGNETVAPFFISFHSLV